MVKLTDNLNDDQLTALFADVQVFKAVYPTMETYESAIGQITNPLKKETFRRLDDWFAPRMAGMWATISGSHRTIDSEFVNDNANVVRATLDHGIGVLNGDAPGADFVSNEVTLDYLSNRKMDPKDHLALILPTRKDIWMERLSHVAVSNHTSPEERSKAYSVNGQLRYIIKNWPEIVFDDYPEKYIDENRFLREGEDGDEYRQEVYQARNGLLAYKGDIFIGLRVNESRGVEHNRDIAEKLERPNLIEEYQIDQDGSDAITDYDTELRIPEISRRSYI